MMAGVHISAIGQVFVALAEELRFVSFDKICVWSVLEVKSRIRHDYGGCMNQMLDVIVE